MRPLPTQWQRKPECKTVGLRTETAYKANGPGKVAPHTEAPGSGPRVNAEVVQLQFAFLSGETSRAGTPSTGSGTTGNRRVEDGGVSRGHSTALTSTKGFYHCPLLEQTPAAFFFVVNNEHSCRRRHHHAKTLRGRRMTSRPSTRCPYIGQISPASWMKST